ncbi:MAG: DUF4115 domain-containing protein [FCB group bacterium]|nr:DUF4115 domain-containing protein [FCB group bacterium]
MANKYTKIGDLLAVARKEQEKSIKESSEATKIMPKYIEALEAGDPTQLPSIPYFQLFARSYSQYLGIDPAILEEIEAVNGETAGILAGGEGDEDDGENEIDSSSSNQTKGFIKTLAYIIGIIVLIFAAFMVYNLIVKDKQADPSGTEIETAASGTGANIDSHDSAEIQDYIVTPYEPPEKLDLHLRARQDVWVVVASDGDTVMNRQLAAGEERRWQAEYRFMLTIGISTAVELTLNGTRLAPLAERAQTIAGLEINQVNYRNFYPSTDTEEEPSPSREIPVHPRFGTADTTGEETGDGH